MGPVGGWVWEARVFRLASDQAEIQNRSGIQKVCTMCLPAPGNCICLGKCPLGLTPGGARRLAERGLKRSKLAKPKHRPAAEQGAAAPYAPLLQPPTQLADMFLSHKKQPPTVHGTAHHHFHRREARYETSWPTTAMHTPRAVLRWGPVHACRMSTRLLRNFDNSAHVQTNGYSGQKTSGLGAARVVQSGLLHCSAWQHGSGTEAA